MATGRLFRQRRWRLGIQGVVVCSLLSACATMQSSPLEVAGVAPEQGIVVGSVLITTEETPPDESKLAFLTSREASAMTYAIIIVRADRGPIGEFFKRGEYKLGGIKPGEEKAFVKTLPAGDYLIDHIEATSFLVKLQYQTPVFFAVERGRTTYIGQFLVQLPSRINQFSGGRWRIVNNQEKTMAVLGKDYAQSLTGITRNLMTIGGRRLVPGDTQASADLQRDVLNKLMTLDYPENPQCTERKVVDTTAISDSEERWTLDRCGTQIPYKVTFRPDPNGGTFFSAAREK